MLTAPANGANSVPRAVMLSIGDIAKRDGVAKPTVSIAVKRLVERHGLTVERDTQGRVALVNAAEYDHLRGRFGDPSKAQAPSPAPAAGLPNATQSSDSYEEAQRQKTWFDVEKRRLEVNETRKLLLRRDRYDAAVAAAALEIARHIDLLPQEADTLAAALGLDEVHAVRTALKGIATKLRTRLAKTFDAMASDAPATDDDLPVEARDELPRSGTLGF